MSTERFFVVCIETVDDEDLLVGRLYRAEVDAAGARSGLIRVWDESGEDYLYPSSSFIQVNVDRGEMERLEGALASR